MLRKTNKVYANYVETVNVKSVLFIYSNVRCQQCYA